MEKWPLLTGTKWLKTIRGNRAFKLGLKRRQDMLTLRKALRQDRAISGLHVSCHIKQHSRSINRF